jgi:phospholipid/cholesterol/gamma-HCH transport system ATP-binding protein
MTANDAHITVKDLTMAYGDFVVMRDLNFTINRGDIFIIMGGSGCGKSTMMTILIGLKSPAKGEVFYGDVDFWGGDHDTRIQIMRKAGVMYQSGALWSSMTLAENVALPLSEYTDLSARQIQEVVRLKLALVGLAGFEEFILLKSAAACRSEPAWHAPWPWIRKFFFLMNHRQGWTRSAPAVWMI